MPIVTFNNIPATEKSALLANKQQDRYPCFYRRERLMGGAVIVRQKK